ncbi:uncharacterized protein LOC143429107 [Xylocopa sonorina]|uniref:uncharacterized protein LOC143429107 n=1 Tax=Xylocopa sonorina TaxID=1818115 RepID=UPI00403ADF3B
MSQHRRRADDFTDSLNSFQYSELDTDTHCSLSEDSLNEIRSAPDLNKRIDSDQVAPNRQFLDSHNELQLNTMDEDSKRDSNYNINGNKSSGLAVTELSIPNVLQEASPSNCTNKKEHICDISCEDEHVNTKAKMFEAVLCSLDNQLNQIKEVSKTQPILKRLSEKFTHAPKDFTDKLLTIIEESVINNDDGTANTSAVDLSRLTTEFRKMCKFIEDESPPKWVSPESISQCSFLTSSMCHLKSYNSGKLHSATNTSTPVKPTSGTDIIRKRFFDKISKNIWGGSGDSNINASSNISFELLEAQCKRLFPEDKESPKPLQRSLSMPSLLSMSQINAVCEQQMASLEVSSITENHNDNSKNLLDKCFVKNSSLNKLQLEKSISKDLSKSTDIQCENVSYSMKKFRKMSEKNELENERSDTSENYITVDPDELGKMLLEDIAAKRKRCLDTARLITEINADAEVIEAQKTLRMSPMFANLNESNSLNNDETKFLNTLISCKDYQTYLQKQKPFFKLLQNSNPSTPETSCKEIPKSGSKHEGIKDLEKKLFNTDETKKQRKRTQKEEKTLKPKYFTTPGKSPSNKSCKNKKIYFPAMLSPTKNTAKGTILKSPHLEGLYRSDYNTVVSPVGMYIRGTNMPLIKNVRPKTNRLFSTPVKHSIKRSPSGNLKQKTPVKNVIKADKKAPLQLNLSPKINTPTVEILAIKTPEDGSTPKNHFILPKVSYKLPLKVKTIKENKSPKYGTRMKKLLEAAESKVVIRHEGRINSVKRGKITGSNEVYDINYESEDESIHIEQAANKTNFLHNRRGF